jgi:hypothetical protein
MWMEVKEKHKNSAPVALPVHAIDQLILITFFLRSS